MVKGLKSLSRKLNRTIPAAVRSATRLALIQGAEEMVTLARHLVPVDEGDLRDSIGWTFGDPPGGSITLAQSKPVGDGERITVYAGNEDVYWARWQEFGSVNHASQPYFFTSYRVLRKRTRSRVTRKMNKAIKGIR